MIWLELLELFFTFFKIGLFTFGGGYAMLPLIQSEVQAKEWLTQSELVDFIAVSESTPGPFAINIATYVGSEVGGVLGSLFATLGVVMPSFIIILIVAQCYEKFKQSRTVQGVLSGLRPAAIGLIAGAVLTAAQTVFVPAVSAPILEVITSYEFICGAVIFGISLPLILKKVHPILVICLAAVLGIVSGYAPMILGF